MEYLQQIDQLVRSSQAGIVLTTIEPPHCLAELQRLFPSGGSVEFFSWSLVGGVVDVRNNARPVLPQPARTANTAQFIAAKSPTSVERVSPYELCDWLLREATERMIAAGEAAAYQQQEALGQPAGAMTQTAAKTRYVVVMHAADHFITETRVDPLLMSQLCKLFILGQGAAISLILQTSPGFRVPVELAEYCEVVNHKLPDEPTRRAILRESGFSDDKITEAVLRVTNGLSGAKLVQFCASSFRKNRQIINPADVFRDKALYLGQHANLDIWSPEFAPEIRLWPTADCAEIGNALEAVLLDEQTTQQDKDIPEGFVRPLIRYLAADSKNHRTKLFDAVSRDEFEAKFRPERDFYTLKSVIGLEGIKQFLINAFRDGVPDRSKLRHVLMLGVPGVGKSMLHKCASGEFGLPLTSIQASKLYSKWLGDTEKTLAVMLRTVEQIRGILGIDEFQRFLPQGGNNDSDVSNRICGAILTWLNDQTTNLVLSAANNVAKLPDEVTRSGRVDAVVFVGFPGRGAKNAAWDMYRGRYRRTADSLPGGGDKIPNDEFWTPADIQSCCRLSEMQDISLERASRWITPSYRKNPEQMDALMSWAEKSGCIDAETGEVFELNRSIAAAKEPLIKVSRTKPARRIDNPENN